MGEVINLNKARKAAARGLKDRAAAENRASFGRSKAERAAQEAERSKAERDLDGKRRDP